MYIDTIIGKISIPEFDGWRPLDPQYEQMEVTDVLVAFRKGYGYDLVQQHPDTSMARPKQNKTAGLSWNQAVASQLNPDFYPYRKSDIPRKPGWASRILGPNKAFSEPLPIP